MALSFFLNDSAWDSPIRREFARLEARNQPRLRLDNQRLPKVGKPFPELRLRIVLIAVNIQSLTRSIPMPHSIAPRELQQMFFPCVSFVSFVVAFVWLLPSFLPSVAGGRKDFLIYRACCKPFRLGCQAHREDFGQKPENEVSNSWSGLLGVASDVQYLYIMFFEPRQDFILAFWLIYIDVKMGAIKPIDCSQSAFLTSR